MVELQVTYPDLSDSSHTSLAKQLETFMVVFLFRRAASRSSSTLMMIPQLPRIRRHRQRLQLLRAVLMHLPRQPNPLLLPLFRSRFLGLRFPHPSPAPPKHSLTLPHLCSQSLFQERLHHLHFQSLPQSPLPPLFPRRFSTSATKRQFQHLLKVLPAPLRVNYPSASRPRQRSFLNSAH